MQSYVKELVNKLFYINSNVYIQLVVTGLNPGMSIKRYRVILKQGEDYASIDYEFKSSTFFEKGGYINILECDVTSTNWFLRETVKNSNQHYVWEQSRNRYEYSGEHVINYSPATIVSPVFK